MYYRCQINAFTGTLPASASVIIFLLLQEQHIYWMFWNIFHYWIYFKCSIDSSYIVWNLYPGISIPVARTAAPCLSQYCSNSFSILRVNKREKLVFVKANFGQYWISNNQVRYWLHKCHINIAAINCYFSSPLLNTSHIISLRWLRLALRK